MRNGYIMLPCSLIGTKTWSHADLWRLWCWCLFTAANKTRAIRIAGVPLRLEVGQLAAPLEDICRATGLTPEAVRQCLAIGKRCGLLDVRATPWWLRINIVNWQDYLPTQCRVGCPTLREARQKNEERKSWT
jgi:hypothetical protein